VAMLAPLLVMAWAVYAQEKSARSVVPWRLWAVFVLFLTTLPLPTDDLSLAESSAQLFSFLAVLLLVLKPVQGVDASKSLRALIGLTLILSLGGILRLAVVWTSPDFFVYETRSLFLGELIPGRYTGAFIDFSNVGVAAILLLAFGACRGGFLGSICQVVGLVNLVFADARAAWAGAFVALLIIIIFQVAANFRRLVLKDLLVTSLSCITTIAFFLSIQLENSNLNGRDALWTRAVNPLIRNEVPLVVTSSTPDSFSAHNALLTYALSAGMLPALILVSIVGSSLGFALKSMLARDPLAMAFVAGFCCILFVEDTLQFSPLNFGVIALIFVTMRAWAVSSESKDARSDLRDRNALTPWHDPGPKTGVRLGLDRSPDRRRSWRRDLHHDDPSKEVP